MIQYPVGVRAVPSGSKPSRESNQSSARDAVTRDRRARSQGRAPPTRAVSGSSLPLTNLTVQPSLSAAGPSAGALASPVQGSLLVLAGRNPTRAEETPPEPETAQTPIALRRQRRTRDAPREDGKVPAEDDRRNGRKAETGSTQDERFKFILNNMTVRRVEPTDRVVFYEPPGKDGELHVYRCAEERASARERLNLDRRSLQVCPIVDNEPDLRLLNFQNNSITRIDNLQGLNNLIFLDLYSNEIEEITGLPTVPTLRVLMLGRNKITQIQNLDCVPRLDVLDLHSNQIRVVENLGSLEELRVLNLAGNQIEEVCNLEGLHSLTELNLRRNQIRSMVGMEQLPNLLRVFLSHNRLESLESLDNLLDSPTLQEVSLDHNPICNAPNYRAFVLERAKNLRHLDLKRIDDERTKGRPRSAEHPEDAREGRERKDAENGRDGKE